MKKNVGYTFVAFSLISLSGCSGKKSTSTLRIPTCSLQTENNQTKLDTKGLGLTGRKLFDAARNNHTGIIKALLTEEVVDVNICNRAGETALHQATLSGSTNAVAALLALGANPNIRRKSDRKMALELAGNNTKIAQLFVNQHFATDAITV